MTRPPDVSVLIVNWNGANVLRNCLASLGDAGGESTVEVIVIDNASADASAEIIPTEFPQVVLIRNATNRGFATANNQAAARAAGRYLFFLNNDTVVPPGAIGKLIQFLDNNAGVVAVGPRLMGCDGRPQRSGRNLPTLRALLHRGVLPARWTGLFARNYRVYRDAFDAERSGFVPQLAAAALLVRQSVFNAAGRWDETFEFGVEDVDLCLRLSRFGKIYYLADVFITHLGRVSSHLNRGWVFRSYQCGYVQYFRKHHRSPLATLIYKIGITVDTPLRLLPLLVKAGVSRLRGDTQQAARSGQRAAALWFFLTRGLLRFWRA